MLGDLVPMKGVEIKFNSYALRRIGGMPAVGESSELVGCVGSTLEVDAYRKGVRRPERCHGDLRGGQMQASSGPWAGNRSSGA